MPHAKSGRLRALAVTSARPSALAPELPTMASQGLDGYEMVAMFGVFAPTRTPPAIVTRLNEVITKYVSQPDVKAKLLNAGLELVGGSAAQFAAAIDADIKRMSKLIKDAGITAE
jgi:tripartite-type tricarboxylate transporter receptor subunit TctC